jgi:hypothetical protein
LADRELPPDQGGTPVNMFKTVPATLQMSAFLPCLQEFNKGKNKGEEQREQGNKESRKQRHKKTTIQQRQQYNMSDVFPAIDFPIHATTHNAQQRMVTFLVV